MMARRRSRPHEVEERRANLTLREALDELVAHVRRVHRTIHEMTVDEIDYAQERLEWMADEIWRIAVEEEDDSL